MTIKLKGSEPSLVRFYRVIPGMRNPIRADSDSGGTMPERAHRACLPLRRASAYGWHLFPPMKFSLMWAGGSELVWSYVGAESWLPVRAVQFPGFPTLFDRVAPFELRPFAPPFLVAFGQTGIVQVWTGLLARVAPGWRLLTRQPVNMARSKVYEIFESLWEMDGCLHPLFMKVRLLRADTPIEFEPDFPFSQVQPLESAFLEDGFCFKIIADVKHFTQLDWANFRNAVVDQPTCRERVLPSLRAEVRGKTRSKRLSSYPSR